jgi:hypothetical protein
VDNTLVKAARLRSLMAEGNGEIYDLRFTIYAL